MADFSQTSEYIITEILPSQSESTSWIKTEIKTEILDIEPDELDDEYSYYSTEVEIKEENSSSELLEISTRIEEPEIIMSNGVGNDNKIRKRKVQECIHCKNIFSSRSTLTRHIKRNVCLKKQINGHWKRNQQNESVYRCVICFKDFDSSNDLTKHYKIHTESMLVKKNVETSEIKEVSEIKIEFVEVKMEPIDTNISMMEEGEEEVNKTQDEFIQKCPHCTKGFKTIMNLNKHLVLHVENLNLNSCQICGRFFYNHTHLKRHIETHQDKKFQCSVCSLKFRELLALKKHIPRHDGVMEFICSICDEKSVNKTAFSEHLDKTHSDLLTNIFKCPECGEDFPRQNALRSHMKHHGNKEGKKFKCSFCQEIFTDKKTFSLHSASHRKVGSFSCSICEKKFFDEDLLISHVKRHSGDLPFKCRSCPEQFSYLKGLERHIIKKGHSG